MQAKNVPLIRLRQLSYGTGSAPLLDGVDLQLMPRERVALVGRNGAGKSTLLKLLLGDLQPDDGELVRQPGLRIAQLSQELPTKIEASVDAFIAAGCNAALNSWESRRICEQLITDLDLEAKAHIRYLSGGMQRRALLARALAAQPELLLLDEPTNHLDIDTIVFLENFLLQFSGCLLMVSHDRAFLQRLATRVVELDRGKLRSWLGDFANFLRRRADALAAEQTQNALFNRNLAREEVWIRQGIKARRTRNEGRVRALQQLRAERRARRELTSAAKMHLVEAEASGRQVITTRDLSFAYPDRPIVDNLNLIIQRGDRVAIVGPNGIGKSTLVHLLLGRIAPDRGSVKHGSKLQIAYFDQQRAELDPQQSVLENVGGGADFIELGGKRTHIMSYLRDFLFTPETARGSISQLSGGERNRLLLAKLFSQPANLLILDEPTNDLDVETLELLEEQLSAFAGTILLISHDRAFIDHVVTSCLVCSGNGKIKEYVGSYSDYLARKQAEQPGKALTITSGTSSTDALEHKRTLQQLRKNVTTILRRINKLEQQQHQLHAQMSGSDFYQQSQEIIAPVQYQLQQVEQELASSYGQWEKWEEQLHQLS